MTRFIQHFIVIVILCCMASCNGGEVYYKFKPIPNHQWVRGQEIIFLLDSVSISSNAHYNVSIEITHNIGYQYKNLFLLLDYTQDSTVVHDTVQCLLVDNLGRWIGNGNGATRQLSVPYKANFRIDTALHNEISIRHAMQRQNLKGIEKIGLKIY